MKTLDTLKRYASHHRGCAATNAHSPEAACTCGMTEAVIASAFELGQREQIISARAAARVREQDGDVALAACRSALGALGKIPLHGLSEEVGMKVLDAVEACEAVLNVRQKMSWKTPYSDPGIDAVAAEITAEIDAQKQTERDVEQRIRGMGGTGPLAKAVALEAEQPSQPNQVTPADVVAAAPTVCACGHDLVLHAPGGCTAGSVSRCSCRIFVRANP